MHHTVILNPTAGGGRSGRRQKALEAALEAAELRFRIVLTETPGHATALACEAACTSAVVVAAGGDGTVQEVAAGLLKSGGHAALGVFPHGTGNDFARVLSLPTAPLAAARVLAAGRTRRADCGLVHWTEDGAKEERLFVNAVGIGFDAEVAVEAARHKHLRGLAAYLTALLRVVRRWPGPHATLHDGRGTRLYEGPLLMATAGNGISLGGGFLLTPRASVWDGKLDIGIVAHAPVRRIVRLLPDAVRGRHGAQPEVRMHRLSALVAESRTGLPLHADGEVLARRAQRIVASVLPGALRVVVP